VPLWRRRIDALQSSGFRYAVWCVARVPRLVLKSGKAIARQWTSQAIRPDPTSPNLSMCNAIPWVTHGASP
jgi:hypothetical protein